MTSGKEDALGQRIVLRDEKEPLAVNHQSFHRLPSPKRLAPCKAELEPASATAGPLIKAPVNADIGEGAVQESTDTAVSDEENITILRSVKASIDFGDDAVLRSFGRLPPAHAPGRFRKEFVGNFLKFLRR